MHIYCLFCMNAHVPAIRKILESSFSCTVLQASILQRKWIKGTPTDVPHDYLPGYLFLYSEEPIPDPYRIIRLEGVIRFLKYDVNEDFEIYGNDRDFAEALYERNGLIRYIPVWQEGDRLKMNDGLFRGQQPTIRKVDRQKKRLQLEFTFDNTVRTIWLGYDIVMENS